jgi:hypothetical protein
METIEGRGYVKISDHEDFTVLHPPFAFVHFFNV